EFLQGQAERVGADLGDDGVRALADIDRTLMQDDLAARPDADLYGRGIGKGGVAAAIPAGGDADAAPHLAGGLVEGIAVGDGARPMRLQRFQAFGDAGRLEPLAAGGGGSLAEGVPEAEVKTVHAELFGEFVVERLLAYRRLRHA